MIFLFAILMFLFFTIIYDYFANYQGRNFALVFSVTIIIIIATIRFKVGIDSMNYMVVFKSIPLLDDFTVKTFDQFRYEEGWLLFASISKSISNSFYLFQFLTAMLFNVSLLYFLKRNTKYVFASLLVYFLLYFLYFNTEILRESMAVAIFLIASRYYFERKFIKYYMLCIIAFYFHHSSVIIFIVPFLHKIRVNKVFYLAILTLFLTATTLWSLFLDNINLFLAVTLEQDKVEVYLNADEYRFNFRGLVYNLLINVVSPLFFIYIAKKKKVFDVDKYAPFLFLFMALGVFSAFNSIIFQRFSNYFIMFFLIVFVECLFYLKATSPLKGFIILCSMFFIFINLYTLFNKDFGNMNKYDRYFPYTTIFDEQRINEREIIYNNN